MKDKKDIDALLKRAMQITEESDGQLLQKVKNELFVRNAATPGITANENYTDATVE